MKTYYPGFLSRYLMIFLDASLGKSLLDPKSLTVEQHPLWQGVQECSSRNDNTIDVHKKQHLQSLDWVYCSVSNSRFVPTINLCLWVCSNLNRNLPEPDELKANVANGNCGESQTLNKSLKICPGKSCPLGLLHTVSVKSQKRHCLMDLQDNDRTYRVTLPRAQSTQ